MEENLLANTEVAFTAVPAAGVHGVGWRKLPGNLLALARGWKASRRLIAEYQPDALFFTGGYVAIPVALAGHRLPAMVFSPDIEPGLAIKFLSRFAERIAVTTESSRHYFPTRKSVTVSGYPVRPDLDAWQERDARKALELSDQLLTLLVFGGSKGARSLNRAVLAALEVLLPKMQIVHLSGHLDWPQVKAAWEALSSDQQARYRAFPYLHRRMGAALRVADLVVSRAGASTLGEFPHFGLPAVLVPYPHAWRYQKVNAQYLAKQGAALVIPDREIGERLAPVVLDLLTDQERLHSMRQAMRALAHPRAAETIALQLLELADHHRQRRM
jgi:UDP-N-acetylglucosamine--N-acetylmuramyl-(pentapeptide) pyrophosphoryl-undecaprenol N-acetylglucosamine transferase